MLSAAAQRDDRSLTPPGKLTEGAVHKIAMKLIAAGLVREVKAKAGMPVWRRDEQNAQSYALKLTAAGLKAIAVSPGDDAAPAADDEPPQEEADESQTFAQQGQTVAGEYDSPSSEALAAPGRRMSERSSKGLLRCFEQPRGRRSQNWRKRWAGCPIPPAQSSLACETAATR
jgi:hypothetical protein